MNEAKLYSATPEGEIAIVKSKITAVVACDISAANGARVLSRVYVVGDKGPFNILEDFKCVTRKI